MIGFSLSFCIADIISGTPARIIGGGTKVITEDDVEKIITSTYVKDASQWHLVLDQYAKVYWSKNPELGVAIAKRLIEQGKIEQPRLLDPWNTHSINEGHWTHGLV